MEMAGLGLSGHVNRRLAKIASDRLADEPVVLLQGPRTVGKSVLLAELAAAHGAHVIDLDDPATADAVGADPATFVAGPSPVCIDEYQHVPDLMGALKAELNRDLAAGRFVLAGSTRSDAVPDVARYLAGRVHLLSVLPLSQGEIGGIHEDLVETLVFGDPAALVDAVRSATSRADYVARVARGGFPIALSRRSGAARDRWFDDYVTTVLERDVAELAKLRQRAQLPVLLRHVAAQTAQVVNISATAERAGLDRGTAAGYLALLEAVFLVRQLPAWGTTLRKRATATPKMHLVDSGLATRLAGLSPERLGHLDPAALSEFGHLLETFVVGEVLKQGSWLEGIARVGHWRTYDGDEVDLIVERADGRIAAVEVKAGSRIRAQDLGPLQRLRDAAGDVFIAGVVFYTGERAYRADDHLLVLPIDRLWRRGQHRVYSADGQGDGVAS